jgi:hypothetical protein
MEIEERVLLVSLFPLIERIDVPIETHFPTTTYLEDADGKSWSLSLRKF